MPTVKFMPDDVTVEVAQGDSILQAGEKAGVPVGSACGGVCACSTCHVYITQGYDSLPDMEDEEDDILDKAFDVRSTSRLGCQAKLQNEDLVVEISRESRETYYNEHPDDRAKAS